MILILILILILMVVMMVVMLMKTSEGETSGLYRLSFSLAEESILDAGPKENKQHGLFGIRLDTLGRQSAIVVAP